MSKMQNTENRSLKQTIIDWVIYSVFFSIVVANLVGLGLLYREQSRFRLTIQKKDVIIQALFVSCEMDWLIKRVRPRPYDNTKRARARLLGDINEIPPLTTERKRPKKKS